MTKQTLRGLAAAFAVLVVGYLFAVFVTLDWNPAHWTALGRGTLAAASLFCAVVTFSDATYDC